MVGVASSMNTVPTEILSHYGNRYLTKLLINSNFSQEQIS